MTPLTRKNVMLLLALLFWLSVALHAAIKVCVVYFINLLILLK